MEQRKSQRYTVDYLETIPEDVRVELIDGEVYDMASPSGNHQMISMLLGSRIFDYIEQNHGKCSVFAAPYGVYLDEENYFEPDLSVICDRDKLDNKGCHGAPDWIIEIVSPGTSRMDYIKKLNKYCDAGVRLYWIVNPMERKVTVWFFEKGSPKEYPFGAQIPVDIYPDFSLTIPDNMSWYK